LEKGFREWKERGCDIIYFPSEWMKFILGGHSTGRLMDMEKHE
jgi:hypothetical protein